MDVTDEQRAALSRELDRVLGTEATTIMMAHLPHGGSDRLATKQDIIELRAEIAQCATKGDLSRFATKEDLSRFATKEDLSRFATKEDLSRFATKGDLSRFATKEDLLDVARRDELWALSGRMDRHIEQVQQIHLDLVKRFTSLEGRMEAMGQSIRAEFRGELVAAVTSQTKSLIISLVSVMAVVSGLAFAIAVNAQ